MKPFTKIILSLILISQFSFGCSLCNLQTPSIHVLVKKKMDNGKIKFNIRWVFNAPFTKNTLDGYPKKYDIKFKLQEIKKSLEAYTSKHNFLTFITYSKNKTLKIDKLLDSNLEVKSDMFFYNYSFIADINQTQYDNISIEFKDDNNYFLFNFNNENIIDKTQAPQTIFIEYLSKSLKSITDDIKALLNNIDNSNSIIDYIWLLFFSFLYGVLHAIGPGHGKSLISSYFLKDESSHLKALSMSNLIGVVHTFSAFILTLVIYYSVSTLLGSYFTNIETIATKISAVIIIAIAIYLIYKKFMKNQHENSCACSGCKTHSTDIGVILAAGIVPCVGTVTIFIYTMSLELYFIGFLSAIFMSLGMSLIIYITALLSIKIRDKSSSNTKLIKLFEYGSLVFILFLGIVLLII